MHETQNNYGVQSVPSHISAAGVYFEMLVTYCRAIQYLKFILSHKNKHALEF